MPGKEMMSGHMVTTAEIKWIALLTMLIDHFGVVVWPQIEIFRIIGRISFPLYIFLLVEGFYHTKSRKRYFFRLLLLAVISEIPFDMGLLLSAGDIRYGIVTQPARQNVMWTLLLGFIYMAFYEIVESRLYRSFANKKMPPFPAWEKGAAFLASLPAAIFLIAIAEVAVTDYHGYGVVAIAACYLVKKWGGPYWLMLVAAAVVLQINPKWHTELAAVISAPMLMYYNGQKGRGLSKLFFYASYPGHLLLLAGIKLLMG